MRKYEGVIVLNTKGNEDGVDKLVSDIGREIESEGAKLEQIDKVGKHKFAYNARHLDEGYYVNFMFAAEADCLPKVQSRLKLNPVVHLQHYQRKG
jgi:small subunit ribosomal protein S6